LDSGVRLRIVTGRKTRLRSAVFNPSGDLVASAGMDGVIRIWAVPDVAKSV